MIVLVYDVPGMHRQWVVVCRFRFPCNDNGRRWSSIRKSGFQRGLYVPIDKLSNHCSPFLLANLVDFESSFSKRLGQIIPRIGAVKGKQWLEVAYNLEIREEMKRSLEAE